MRRLIAKPEDVEAVLAKLQPAPNAEIQLVMRSIPAGSACGWFDPAVNRITFEVNDGALLRMLYARLEVPVPNYPWKRPRLTDLPCKDSRTMGVALIAMLGLAPTVPPQIGIIDPVKGSFVACEVHITRSNQVQLWLGDSEVDNLFDSLWQATQP